MLAEREFSLGEEGEEGFELNTRLLWLSEARGKGCLYW